MPNCQDIGQIGSNMYLTLTGDHGIPPSLTCNLTGYSQSSNGQYAQVMDKNGNIVAQISSTTSVVAASASSGASWRSRANRAAVR